MADGNYTTPQGTAASISKAVKGEFALGIQRIFVIVGIPILLGVGGFLGVRAVTNIDDLAKRIDHQGNKTQEKLEAITSSLNAQSSAVTVLQSTMAIRGSQRDGEIREINSKVADHETRIRGLERPTAGLAGPR